MDKKISIYIIENYNLTRALYKHNLSNEFEIKGEFKDEKECLKAFNNDPSDIILTDLRLPYEQTFNFIKKIKSKYPDTKIIILSTVDDEEIMYTTATLGVSGYILKDIEFPVLIETIKQIHYGKLYFGIKEEDSVLI